jgi:hypothetical protein
MNPNTGLQSIDYDGDTDSYEITYDEETAPSVAVPTAMQEITQIEIRDLESLHAVIDPEALDELFKPPNCIGPLREGHVTFIYQDHTVTVFSDHRLVIKASDD